MSASDPRTVPTYKLWINDERTILVHMWANGNLEIAFREHRDDIWGPPVRLIEEKP